MSHTEQGDLRGHYYIYGLHEHPVEITDLVLTKGGVEAEIAQCLNICKYYERASLTYGKGQHCGQLCG